MSSANRSHIDLQTIRYHHIFTTHMQQTPIGMSSFSKPESNVFWSGWLLPSFSCGKLDCACGACRWVNLKLCTFSYSNNHHSESIRRTISFNLAAWEENMKINMTYCWSIGKSRVLKVPRGGREGGSSVALSALVNCLSACFHQVERRANSRKVQRMRTRVSGFELDKLLEARGRVGSTIPPAESFNNFLSIDPPPHVNTVWPNL